MANRLHKVIFSYINCLEFYFFRNYVEVVVPDRRTWNSIAKMLPVSSQSRRSLFRWTFYRKISRIQQCRAGPRSLQL